MKLRGSRVRALWTTVIALIVGTTAYVLAVLNETGQRLEASVLSAASFDYTPAGPLMLVSNTSVIIALIVAVILALIRWGMGRAVVVFVAPALALLLSQVLKLAVLERPPLWEVDAVNTFPSGHVTVYAVLIGALIWAVPPSFRGFMSVFGTALLGLVTLQILAYGWHRPSDVVGAIALTLASFGLVAWVAPLREKSIGAKVQPRLSRKLLKLLVVLGVAVAAVAAFVGLVTDNGSAWLVAGESAALAGCAFCNREILSLTIVR